MTQYPDWFIARIRSIKNRRPRTVAEHILEHGSITTEELAARYGYNHPPRAARDLRELGIPLETFRVKNTEGRTIAAYRFGDLNAVREDRLSGRRIFSKHFKQQLVQQHGAKCAVCNADFEPRYLQIDHRIPYEVAGEIAPDERNPEDYMLLCGECNRAKSWSCEHCANWLDDKNSQICLTCYWANPVQYTHIALRNMRRLALVWAEDETKFYETLSREAENAGLTLSDFIKQRLKQHKS